MRKALSMLTLVALLVVMFAAVMPGCGVRVALCALSAAIFLTVLAVGEK